jgi:pyruvate carboxylase
MYPKVFRDFCAHQERYDDVSILPTPVFFYGLEAGQEIAVELEKGKTLYVGLNAQAEADGQGGVRMYFDVNGQPRAVRALKRQEGKAAQAERMANANDPMQVASPMQGSVISVGVQPGQAVAKGDTLAAIEAMKMETSVVAEASGTVKSILVQPGTLVRAGQLLIELQ